jgi:hypothetical protein
MRRDEVNWNDTNTVAFRSCSGIDSRHAEENKEAWEWPRC